MTHGVLVSGVVLSPVSLAVTEEHVIIGIQGLCLFVLEVFVLRLPHTSRFFCRPTKNLRLSASVR